MKVRLRGEWRVGIGLSPIVEGRLDVTARVSDFREGSVVS